MTRTVLLIKSVILSYYINNITLPSNVTLLFINGEHLIKPNEVLDIKGHNIVTLLGQGQWVHGFHHSVIQSSVIIKCTYTTRIAVNVSVIHVSLIMFKGRQPAVS